MLKHLIRNIGILSLSILIGCQQTSTKITNAIIQMAPTDGYSAQGIITLHETQHGLQFSGKITGLTPNGSHGFHIHQWGDITAKNGTNTGGHYNPNKHPHNHPQYKKRHIGDLGNLTADSKGTATINLVIPNISLNGPHSIIGRSIIIHKGPDDFKTQPSGASGPRISQGVIGIAKPTQP